MATALSLFSTIHFGIAPLITVSSRIVNSIKTTQGSLIGTLNITNNGTMTILSRFDFDYVSVVNYGTMKIDGTADVVSFGIQFLNYGTISIETHVLLWNLVNFGLVNSTGTAIYPITRLIFQLQTWILNKVPLWEPL